jgi:hypothetical protein
METNAVDQFAELLGVQVLHRSFDEAIHVFVFDIKLATRFIKTAMQHLYTQ